LPGTLAEVADALRDSDAAAASYRMADRIVPGRLLERDVVLGWCWATVDLERTLAEVPLPFVAAGRDRMLGGVAVSASIGALALVAEEPDSEGRLAAFLARYGEGLCAVYVQRADKLGTSRIRPTPIGSPGSVLAHGSPWGPFVIAIEPAG
jgi:hypothetical protein